MSSAVETSLSLGLWQKTATALQASQRRRGQKTATGSRGSVIAHGGPRSVPHGHGCEAAVAIFRDPGSVETRGKIATTLTCLAMTGDEAASRHFCLSCARSAFWQVPSDGSCTGVDAAEAWPRSGCVNLSETHAVTDWLPALGGNWELLGSNLDI
jgi:hypothetical protein